MTDIIHLFKRNITTSRLDAKLGQAFCWTGSLVMMTAGILKLTRLQLTESELFFGILLVMAVTMLGIVARLLLPVVEYVAREQRRN